MYGYSSWEQMEPSEQAPGYITEAIKSPGFTSPQDYSAKRTALADAVRPEIWRRVAGATVSAESVPKAGEWAAVSYLKTLPGKGADYDKIWKSYSLPLREERVKAGKIKSYSMWSVGGGGGTGVNYDRVSLVRYARFKDISPAENATSDLSEPADKVHSGKDWRQMHRDIIPVLNKLRQLVFHRPSD